MLIAIERLLIKLRQPRSRADELVALRGRLRAELARDVDEDDDERTLARAVHARKLAVTEELRAVSSCRSCATGYPSPIGHYAGGACCAGITEQLFDDTEVAALAHTGTRPRSLTAPHDEHAGCAFRGARGCTLAVAHRPARCVHYVCTTLRRELFHRGQLDALEAKLADLDVAMQRFRAAYQARADRDVLAAIADAVEHARP
ncbi:MAG: hypothetical protein M3680_23945 [Myxococcota bacterium]|nr:hypothetical protein [Myxococcota bacterium]